MPAQTAPNAGSALTPWTRLLAALRTEPGLATLDVTADRTVFGGLQAAIALSRLSMVVFC